MRIGSKLNIKNKKKLKNKKKKKNLIANDSPNLKGRLD